MDTDRGRVAYTNEQKEIYHMQVYLLEFFQEVILSNTGLNILSQNERLRHLLRKAFKTLLLSPVTSSNKFKHTGSKDSITVFHQCMGLVIEKKLCL